MDELWIPPKAYTVCANPGHAQINRSCTTFVKFVAARRNLAAS